MAGVLFAQRVYSVTSYPEAIRGLDWIKLWMVTATAREVSDELDINARIQDISLADKEPLSVRIHRVSRTPNSSSSQKY